MGLRQWAQAGFLEAVAPLPRLTAPQTPTPKASGPPICEHSYLIVLVEARQIASG